MTLVVDYMGCQQAMCASCEHLQECPLHNEIERLRSAGERGDVMETEWKCESCGVFHDLDETMQHNDLPGFPSDVVLCWKCEAMIRRDMVNDLHAQLAAECVRWDEIKKAVQAAKDKGCCDAVQL